MFLYVGAVIGAGFASGQEILQFFAVHGNYGLAGALVATLLMSYLSSLILYFSVALKTTNYMMLVSCLAVKWPAKIFDFLGMVILFAGLSVMLSGSGAVLCEYLGLSAWFGVILLAIINCLVLLGGLTGIIKVYSWLVPLKIAVILVVSLLVIIISYTGQGNGFTGGAGIFTKNWVTSSVLYVSYNMLLVVALLSTLGDKLDFKTAVTGGIAGSVVLGAIITMVTVAEIKLYPGITSYKVPVLYMAGTITSLLKVVAAMIIWAAVLTTAVANTHGLAARFANPGTSRYKLAGTVVTLLALPLAFQDFDKLVGNLYPAFGYVGLALMVVLVFEPILKSIEKLKH